MAQFLKPIFTPSFNKQYKKLSIKLQRKFTKQLEYLVKNYRHPSLRAKKMESVNKFEARIDRHNRFTFQIEDNQIILRNIGPHDTGLGKK